MEIYSPILLRLTQKSQPDAAAWLMGNAANPRLGGTAHFYAVPFGGIVVNIEMYGLPDTELSPSHFYGVHIHETGNCTLPFDQTGNHYNPTDMLHPGHAGDMPPLLSYSGYAWQVFYDGRLTIDKIVDRSVIVHANRDDFTTQPSGDSGAKIACGVIKRVNY